MKIRMTITLDVDPMEWATEYGIHPATPDFRGEVREDVKSYVMTGINGLASIESGLIRSVKES